MRACVCVWGVSLILEREGERERGEKERKKKKKKRTDLLQSVFVIKQLADGLGARDLTFV